MLTFPNIAARSLELAIAMPRMACWNMPHRRTPTGPSGLAGRGTGIFDGGLHDSLCMGWMPGGARFLTAAAPALGWGGEARADHIFTLSGVTFDDGTSATGTFTTNDALNSLVNFDITTTNGAITGFDTPPRLPAPVRPRCPPSSCWSRRASTISFN